MRRIATLAASHVRHRGGGGNTGYRPLRCGEAGTLALDVPA
jgi:hypothetical protein